jgi:hypothetical protein
LNPGRQPRGHCTNLHVHVGKQVPAKTFLVYSPFLGYATIDDAVFSMRPAPSNSRITGLCCNRTPSSLISFIVLDIRNELKC